MDHRRSITSSDVNFSPTQSRVNPVETSGENPAKRQKRDKYTAVACNGCKKRKIKCDGGETCQRCAQLGVQCVYTPGGGDGGLSTISRLNDLDVKYRSLQRQVDELQYQIRNPGPVIGSNVDHSGSTHALDRRNSTAPRKRFEKDTQGYAGPSSIQYGLDVGKSSLRNIGLHPDEAVESTVPNSAVNTRSNSPVPRITNRASRTDPLRGVHYDEALRLIRMYEEELYPIYPIINAEHMEHVAMDVLPFSTQQNRSAKMISHDDRDIDILKLTIATSLILEGQGQNDLADELVSVVQENVSNRSWNKLGLKDVMIMAMMSIYFFQCDEEILAWRTIGVSVRIALEIGMHRHKSIQKMFPDHTARRNAVRLFWAIYVLDQRWSLGTGLPCALNQADIDPELPEPEDASPYTRSLLSYARLSSKVMKSVDNGTNLAPKERKDEIEYLDFQLQQWYQSMPPELLLVHPSVGPAADQQPRNMQRLRVLLFARYNHLRIINRRGYLLSTSRITEHLSQAEFVVKTAKDTIQVLAHLNRVSTIYQMQQSLYNYFLISALTALFLAVCHGSAYFGATCRPEFTLALDLIKNFSTKSLVSRRLWKAVREIRSLASKIGMESRNGTDGDVLPTSTEESARNGHETPHMMGMSQQVGAILANSIVPSTQTWDLDLGWSPSETMESWITSEGGGGSMATQMSHALTDLYETMGGSYIVQ